jgi:hypothetical protein
MNIHLTATLVTCLLATGQASANWLDKFMSSHSATINAYTTKPEKVKQANQAIHVVQAIKTAYVPRRIVVSSQQ